MQAVTYRSLGAAKDVLTLEEIETPAPAAGEVLVELAFSGINPSDVKARSGARPGVTKPAFPVVIPHSDGSGVITAVGKGVDSSRIGQQVYIWNGQWQRAFGTAATHIALPSEQAVALPQGCSLEQGAVLGIPAMTAAYLVHGAGDIAQATVLVQGGGGTVGYLAVQMAAQTGARVLATCSPRDADRVRAAGADVVLNYSDPDLADQILGLTDGRGVDRVIEVEFGQNIDTVCQAIAPQGRIMAYGSANNMTPAIPYGPLMFKAVTIETVLVYILQPAGRALVVSHLDTAFSSDGLIVPIETILPLSDCATAHQKVEAGGRKGAVLLSCR
jgi:NADPH2:quinone reductase